MISDLLQAFLPLIIPALAGTAVLLLGALNVKGRWLCLLTIASLIGGLISVQYLHGEGSLSVASLFLFDPFAVFFLRLLYSIVIVVAILGAASLKDDVPSQEVFYGILLFALTGMGVVVATNHLAIFFLGLEIYTACLYILIAFYQNRRTGEEAAIKYLILGAVSSGFILLGIALLYLGFGSLELSTIAERLISPSAPHLEGQSHLWLAGSTCLFVGVCFKLSLVPFHMWAPDVYQGAPTAVTAFISTASKAAVLAIVIRYLSLFTGGPAFTQALVPVVIASLIIGNLLALYQQNLKRLLAYSSIAHLGYAFVPLCVGGFAAWSASLIYLVTYILTALAAFSLIILEEGETETAGNLENYRGLGHRKPLRAAAIAVTFFSLAGIPMTAGFIGKWSIFQAALAGEQYLLVGAVIIGAALGAFYYLRVVASLYFSEETAPVSGVFAKTPLFLRLIVLILLLKILIIGVYPEPLIQQVRSVIPVESQYDYTLYGSSESASKK